MTAHCEAKLHAFRRTQDGVVVSFVIHPHEIPQALALDPLGTRYMLAFSAISDDEQPRDPAAPMPESRPSAEVPPMNPHLPAGANPLRSRAAKERYSHESPMEQARDRAIMLCKDGEFQRWAMQQPFGSDACTEDHASAFVRDWCGIQSRGELADDNNAYLAFLRLEAKFREATGRQAEIRG